MRRVKLVMQMLVAFIIATLAYNLFYEPHQDRVRAAVQQQMGSGQSIAIASDSAPGFGSLSDFVASLKSKAANAFSTAENKVGNVVAVAEGKLGMKQATYASNATDIPAGKLRITVLDVGQAEAILLQDGKRNVLVDVGDSRKDKQGFGGRESLRRSLAKAGLREGVDRIHTVIITHHHGDHLGNIKWLAGKYKVSNIYDNNMPNANNAISQWLNTELRAGHYHNRVLKAGDRVVLDNGYGLEVLAPGGFVPHSAYKESFNNTSIVMMLRYGQFKMLLTGDAEAPVEDALQQRYGAELQADVLKVGHHGSKTSSIYKFTSKVRPKYALVSCGPFEIYHHPNKKVVGSLQHLGAQVLTTKEHGNLTVITDGRGFEVKTEK